MRVWSPLSGTSKSHPRGEGIEFLSQNLIFNPDMSQTFIFQTVISNKTISLKYQRFNILVFKDDLISDFMETIFFLD